MEPKHTVNRLLPRLYYEWSESKNKSTTVKIGVLTTQV
jgi:hypothetical protein